MTRVGSQSNSKKKQSCGLGELACVASVAQMNYLSQGVIAQYDSGVSYSACHKEC
jgi:hypothetical protein